MNVDLLREGAHLIVNVSGGKDSDAMSLLLAEQREREGWAGRFILLHQDVGRMDWPQSKPHCRLLAEYVGAEYFEDRRTEGDLLERIWQRARALVGQGKPPWPSKPNRYCTSELKTAIADRWTRNAFVYDATVVHTLGLRAEESKDRAKKPVWSYREDASAYTKRRDVYTWLPIHTLAINEVWDTLKRFDWEPHPAYAMGNHRVSCCMCVLADKNDLLIGAAQNPEIYNELVEIEIFSGYSFQDGKWLGDLRPDLLEPERLERFQAMRNAKSGFTQATLWET